MAALTMAIITRRPKIGEVIFHSDRGSQYTARAFRELCLSNGIIPSVGHTGICYDNAAPESWNATLKKELIHLHIWRGLAHVKSGLFEYTGRTTTVSGYRRSWGTARPKNTS